LQVLQQVLLRLFVWMSLKVMLVLREAEAAHRRKVRQVLREEASAVYLPQAAASLQEQLMVN
jgi:hypothetical protein